MTKTVTIEDAALPDDPPPVAFTLVTLDELEAVDLTTPIADVDQVDCHVLEQRYQQAAIAAEAVGEAVAGRVYRLLASLCSFHFKVEDRAGAFGPQLVLNDRRTAIPDDFRGAQNQALAAILPDIAHPGLRARIADTVWTNDRRQVAAANVAIDAYCEALEGLGTGLYRGRLEHQAQASFEEIDLVHRALQIASQINKKGQVPERVRDNITRLYETAKLAVEPIPFERVGRTRLLHQLISPAELAADAENVGLAAMRQPKTYPLAIKAVWTLGAFAREQAGDTTGAQEFRLKAIDQTLAMRNEVHGASAAASWIRTAISELRHIPDTKDLRESLHRELRQVQEIAHDEFGVFATPLDLGDMQTGTIAIFDPLTLPDALLQFALLAPPRSTEELRKEAIDGIKNAPLLAMLGSVYSDEEGKVVAEAPGASMTGEPSEEWIKGTIARNQPFWHHIVVVGRIEPARQTIAANYPFSERDFLVIAGNSPFIPATHQHTFALGFTRFMQGDFISAAHLLIPQVEHSVRHVLRSANFDSSKIMPDMLQEDRPLSALLEQHRPAMDQIFSADVTDEIDRLFNYRPGPALRHEFAHGKVPSAQCFDPSVIYACWFIYHLCCVPLLRYWKEHIGPAIEAHSF